MREGKRDRGGNLRALPDVLRVSCILFDDGEDGSSDNTVSAGKVVINLCREDISITLPEQRAHLLSFNAWGAGD